MAGSEIFFFQNMLDRCKNYLYRKSFVRSLSIYIERERKKLFRCCLLQTVLTPVEQVLEEKYFISGATGNGRNNESSYGTLQFEQAAISPQNFIFPQFLRCFLDVIFPIHTKMTSRARFHLGFFYQIFPFKVE